MDSRILTANLGRLTLSYLGLYYLGKFSAGVFDRHLPSSLRGILIPSIFALILAGIAVSDSYLLASGFLFGISSVFGGIALREYLTLSQDFIQKKYYNALTTVGWSLGVAAQGFIFKFGNYVVYTMILVLFGFSFLLIRKLPQIKLAKSPDLKKSPLISEVVSIFQSPASWTLFLGATLYFATSALINSHIVAYIRFNEFVSPEYFSIVLAIPILGAVVGLLPMSQPVSGFKTETKYLIFKLTTILVALLLFSTSDFLLFAALLALIGFVTNEETAISYQMVSEDIDSLYRRQAHALLEIFGLVGSGVGWLIGDYLVDVQYSLLTILILFFLLIWANSNAIRYEVQND
jgi:hypothetical protein